MTPQHYSLALLLLLVGRAAESPSPPPTSLPPATIAAFQLYSSNVESVNAHTLQDGPFLWIDGLHSAERNELLAKLKSGQVAIRRLSLTSQGRNPDIPGGMIHDWEGIVFIPGVKLDDVLRVLLARVRQVEGHFRRTPWVPLGRELRA